MKGGAESHAYGHMRLIGMGATPDNRVLETTFGASADRFTRGEGRLTDLRAATRRRQRDRAIRRDAANFESGSKSDRCEPVISSVPGRQLGDLPNT